MEDNKSKLKQYYSDIPEFRADRISKIRKVFLTTVDKVEETFKYNMPTFEKGGNWVALANQKNYISVYFCSEELISGIKKKYPKLNTGKGCVRIGDKNELILDDLKKSFKKAMSYK